MKIEKINDNQIRCTLNRQDLASREIKISELAYGTQKARELFRDMIEQADDEFGFSADDMPLMIEAIPISMECIVLIITKVDDPDELDPRFSRFSAGDNEPGDDLMNLPDLDELFSEDKEEPIDGLDGAFDRTEEKAKDEEHTESENSSRFVSLADAMQDMADRFSSAAQLFRGRKESDTPTEDESNYFPAAADEEPETDAYDDRLTGDDESEAGESFISQLSNVISQYVQNAAESDRANDTVEAPADTTPEDTEATPQDSPEEDATPEKLQRIYSFGSWDEAAEAARSIRTVFDGEAVLYKDDKNALYYLSISGYPDAQNHLYAISNELAEYGSKIRLNYSTPAYLAEHCKVLIRENALDVLKTY